MSEDYLWDKSGPKDPEIEELEALLQPFRLPPEARTSGHSLEVLAQAESPVGSIASDGKVLALRPSLRAAIAAATILIVASVLLNSEAPPAPYCVSSTEGSPDLIARTGSTELDDGRLLSPGDWIETGPGESVSMAIADIGSVQLLPGSRLGVASAEDIDDTGKYGLYLDRGTLSATIYAAPRLFQVGTPAGIAVDMGCVYRATVTDEGDTILTVDMGVVQFETEDGFAYVPADAACIATKGAGPCPPYWEDRDDAFQRAAQARDIDYLIENAEDRDSLTLWHFLLDDDRVVRRKALGALVQCQGGPDHDVERLMAGDKDAIHAYRKSFDWSW